MKKKVSFVLLTSLLFMSVSCGGSTSQETSSKPSEEPVSSEVSEEIKESYYPDLDSDAISLYYESDTELKNCAQGTLLVQKKEAFPSSAASIEVKWGDENGPFDDYDALALFEELNRPDFEYSFKPNALIPFEATKLWVVIEDENGEVLDGASLGFESKKKEEVLKTSFQVISDNQVSVGTPAFYRRTLTTFQDIKKECPDTAGIFVNGDIVDEYSEANYDSFYEAYDSVFESRDLLHVGIGNHEFIVQSETDYDTASPEVQQQRYQERLAMWEEKTGNTSPYFYDVVDGSYHIFLGATEMPHTLDGNTRADCTLGEEQLSWLADALEDAKKSENPIFLYSHGSLRDTVDGSLTSLRQTWYGYTLEEETALRNLIDGVENLTFFSSHSHWCFESEQPYLLEGTNFFNTAAIGYLWEGEGGGHSYKNGSYEYGGAQGLYVEVYEDCIAIRGRQFEASDGKSKNWFSNVQVLLPLA